MLGTQELQIIPGLRVNEGARIREVRHILVVELSILGDIDKSDLIQVEDPLSPARGGDETNLDELQIIPSFRVEEETRLGDVSQRLGETVAILIEVDELQLVHELSLILQVCGDVLHGESPLKGEVLLTGLILSRIVENINHKGRLP